MEKRGRKAYKVIVVIVVVLIAVFTAFIVWWGLPARLLNRTDAQKIAYIEVRDGSNGKKFRVEDAEDIAYIINNIQESHLFRDGISLGYVGYLFHLSFYDDKDRCVESLIINHYNTLRKDPFFYLDSSDSLCLDYLCELESELAGD